MPGPLSDRQRFLQTGFLAMAIQQPGERWVRRCAVMLTAAVVACSSVKTTAPGVVGIDRKQYMSPLVSERQLEQGSLQAYTQVIGEARSKGALNVDSQQTQRVQTIARRLIDHVGVFRQDAATWNWEANVIESEQINAWAMPGGKMAVYSGIIEKLNLTDDELAAIMGHEISHALREHGRERASSAANQSLIAGIIGAGLGSQDAQQLANVALKVAVGLPNSRVQESEADRMGLELSARAGFDPRAAVTLWQKMAKASGGQSQPAFLSTHPSPDDRIEDLRALAEKVMPLYRAAGKAS